MAALLSLIKLSTLRYQTQPWTWSNQSKQVQTEINTTSHSRSFTVRLCPHSQCSLVVTAFKWLCAAKYYNNSIFGSDKWQEQWRTLWVTDMLAVVGPRQMQCGRSHANQVSASMPLGQSHVRHVPNKRGMWPTTSFGEDQYFCEAVQELWACPSALPWLHSLAFQKRIWNGLYTVLGRVRTSHIPMYSTSKCWGIPCTDQVFYSQGWVLLIMHRGSQHADAMFSSMFKCSDTFSWRLTTGIVPWRVAEEIEVLCDILGLRGPLCPQRWPSISV